PSSLTDLEKYIISGAEADASGSYLRPWVTEVFDILDIHRQKNGSLPAVLDEAAIRSCFEGSQAPTWMLERLKSPLTGSYPRTDQLNFSPGDIYCRQLTDSEISFIAP